MIKLIIFKIVKKITGGRIIGKTDDRKINDFHTGGFDVRCRKTRGGEKAAACAYPCPTESRLYEAQTYPRRHGNAFRVRQRRGAFVLDERYAASSFDRVHRFERPHPRHIRHDAVQLRARREHGERALCSRSAAGLVRSRQYKSRRHARFRFRHARGVGTPAAHRARTASAGKYADALSASRTYIDACGFSKRAHPHL